MSAPSVDIKDILVAEGIGTFAATNGWAIYISKEPTDPDTCVTLYDTGGFDPSPAYLQDTPTIQVRVRAAPGGYVAGYAKAQGVKDALLGMDAQTINGTRYVGCWMMGDITFLMYDESNRPIWTMNFRLIREPAAGGNRRPA